MEEVMFQARHYIIKAHLVIYCYNYVFNACVMSMNHIQIGKLVYGLTSIPTSQVVYPVHGLVLASVRVLRHCHVG